VPGDAVGNEIRTLIRSVKQMGSRLIPKAFAHHGGQPDLARAHGPCLLDGEMKPIAARVLITLIVLAFVIGASVFVNSRFHGSFAAGIIVLVLPFLALSFSLPYLLPVRCPKCSGKMRFHFLKQKTDSPQMYAYVCDRCTQRHEWEAASSSSSFDS
jgi:hypothetical protein